MEPVVLLVTLLELMMAELLLAPALLLVVLLAPALLLVVLLVLVFLLMVALTLVVVLPGLVIEPAVLVVVEVVAGDLAAWDWLQGSPRLGRATHFNCKLPS